jgi:hypothetical protein
MIVTIPDYDRWASAKREDDASSVLDPDALDRSLLISAQPSEPTPKPQAAAAGRSHHKKN